MWGDGEDAHPRGDLGSRSEDEHVHLTWTSSLSLPAGTEGVGLRGRYAEFSAERAICHELVWRRWWRPWESAVALRTRGKIVVQITPPLSGHRLFPCPVLENAEISF